MVFLTYVRQLPRRHDWHKLLAELRDMAPCRDAERTWIREFSLASSQSDAYEAYGAVATPGDATARFSVSLAMNDSQHPTLPYGLFEAEEQAQA